MREIPLWLMETVIIAIVLIIAVFSGTPEFGFALVK